MAGVVALAAIAGFFMTRGDSREPSDAELAAAASSAAATVTARLTADGQLLSTLAASIDHDAGQPLQQLRAELLAVAPADAVLGVAPLTADGHAPVVVAAAGGKTSTALTGVDLTSRPEWRLALDLARDRAGPGAVVSSQPDGTLTVFDVLPLFGRATVPADITGRRSALRGYLVSSSPTAVLVGLPAAPGTEVAVRVVDGATVLGGEGQGATQSPPGDAVNVAVTANGVTWNVQAWATPSSSAVPWIVLVGGLLLAAVVGGVALSRERFIERSAAEMNERAQELALIARSGPLLQRSLALGDLLPVFVVEVGDELGLDGVSISLSSDAGEFVRVFSLGTSASPALGGVESLGAPPESVAPGDLVTIPLQRVGRVVGAFQARAVTGLSPSQMETLIAVCALLAAAVGNVRLYEDEQHMVSRLRDVDRMKTSFIGSVSHELRTSVTAIQGFSSLLEDSTRVIDETTRADYVARISRNARSLAVLIEDLLDFARFERSGLTTALAPIDLSDLVPKVVDQMSSVLGGRPVSVAIEPGVIAMADTSGVERILANLLSNASKYTPPDCAVTVELESDGTNAVLLVSDDGPGVAEDERERIFELFYRSDQSARVTRGVGIGLALTRQLVEHLNGTIVAEEAPGGGACFRVTIPIALGATSPATPVIELQSPGG